MTGPLDGIRVVELCIMAAGPATALQLAELGAEVIKIEPPSGDGTRWAHPSQRGMGTNFIAMNVGKRDATADLKDPYDHTAVLDLVRDSDVFLQNLRGGVAARLGVGPTHLAAINPRLVYCSISGFGSIGPLAPERCSDTIMQAFSGFARINGDSHTGLEQFRFTGLLDLITASIATQSIIAALVDRQSTGQGQHVDVSMLEAALEIQATRFGEYLGSGRMPEPLGSDSSMVAPDGAFAARDKEVFFTVRDDVEWRLLCDVIKRPDLAENATFVTNAGRVENRALLREVIEPIIAAKPALWWQRSLARHGIAVTTAWDFEQLSQHIQVRQNEMVADVDTPWGMSTVGGVPWHFSATPARVASPPNPGEFTDALMRGLPPRNRPPAQPSADANAETERRSILSGLRVVEISSGIAGALAALRLQDLGADVIKVEQPSGDWLRDVEPIDDSCGTSSIFAALNRGKRFVAADVDDPAGSDFLDRLFDSADVVVSDWSQRGIPSATHADHLRRSDAGASSAVWLELSDFGGLGPQAHRPGSEVIVQAMAGYTGWIGDGDSPALRLGSDIAGCATAIFAGSAALAALFARRNGIGGQVVRLSGLNSLLSLASIHLAAQTDPDDYVGQRVGGAFFPRLTGWKTADTPIVFAFGGAVGSAGRPGWQRFITEIQAEWLLDDPLFADDPTGRQTTGHGIRVEACRSTYESVFKDFTAETLVEVIRRHGGQAAAFQDYEQLIHHPQVVHLDLVRDVGSNGRGGRARVLAFPARFSGVRLDPRAGVRPVGADTEIVRSVIDAEQSGGCMTTGKV